MRTMNARHHKEAHGFTLMEILVSIGIIAVLATVVLVAIGPAARNSRDTARKAQLDLIRRFLASGSCYAPAGGPGDYDLTVIVDELTAENPQVAEYASSIPKDPRSGTATESGYRYLYGDGGHCALYANLENAGADVTLPGLSEPTAGGGTGTLEASSEGPNGTDRYYQISK